MRRAANLGGLSFSILQRLYCVEHTSVCGTGRELLVNAW